MYEIILLYIVVALICLTFLSFLCYLFYIIINAITSCFIKKETPILNNNLNYNSIN